MAINFPFHCGLSPTEPAITSQNKLWSSPLPTDKSAILKQHSSTENSSSATYGDYFVAAKDFLQRDDMALLRHAVGQMVGCSIALQDLKHVGVYLVKHGAYYHPARVEAALFDRTVALVLNVAFSDRGRQALLIEFDALSRLSHELSRPWWPKFYGHGHGDCGDGRQWSMMIGQWLEHYYEFHLDEDEKTGHLHVVVWDSQQGHRILDERQACDLIGRAAEILSNAYHPLTFEAILDWHHAAGDFVVRVDDGGLDVRLITVRNYAPLVAGADVDVEAVLDAMVAFLTGISLRLRLDRVAGVGRLAVYPQEVVPAIWEGFCRGLQSSVIERALPDDFADAVIEFIRLQGVKRLSKIANTLIENYPSDSETRHILERICTPHLDTLWAAISA